MAQKMMERKIPSNMKPWKAIVNGVEYVYPAGETVSVPLEVAILIYKWYAENEVEFPDNRIDYNDLKNRPCYEETEVLLDQTIDCRGENSSAEAVIDEMLPINVGDVVAVTWDGVKYECVAFGATIATDNDVAFGNTAVVEGDYTGEPFFVSVSPGIGTIFIDFGERPAVHSVKIEKVTVKKLDPKYIPDGVGGGVVIVQDSAMASGVMAADQDVPTATMNAAEIAEAVFAGKTVYFNAYGGEILLPFSFGYRFQELRSGVMAAPALPDPYAVFAGFDEWFMPVAFKVFTDGSYEVISTGGSE